LERGGSLLVVTAKIKSFTSGKLKSNSYIITDDDTYCIIIDPGEKPQELIKHIGSLPVAYIFITHSHYDHISGLNELKNYTDASVVVHHSEAEWLVDPKLNRSIQTSVPIVSEWPDILLNGDELVQCGSLTIKAIHTPGHTPGSTCFLVDNQYLFTGDTLLAGIIGPTNLPYSDRNMLKRSIKEKLFTLNEDIIVYPGHGQKTTIGFERENNLLPNIKSFY
jgi:hydroxyacylglutathione hydrolase